MPNHPDLRIVWPGRPVRRLGRTNRHAACTELLPGAVGKCSFLHGVCCVQDLHHTRQSLRQRVGTAGSRLALDSLWAMLPSQPQNTACLLLTCAAHSASVEGRAASWQASQDSAWPCD